MIQMSLQNRNRDMENKPMVTKGERGRYKLEEFGINRYTLLLLLLLNRVSHVRLCAAPQTAAHQAPLSLGCSRQEHWSGLPFPSPVHESGK